MRTYASLIGGIVLALSTTNPLAAQDIQTSPVAQGIIPAPMGRVPPEPLSLTTPDPAPVPPVPIPGPQFIFPAPYGTCGGCTCGLDGGPYSGSCWRRLLRWASYCPLTHSCNVCNKCRMCGGCHGNGTCCFYHCWPRPYTFFLQTCNPGVGTPATPLSCGCGNGHHPMFTGTVPGYMGAVPGGMGSTH